MNNALYEYIYWWNGLFPLDKVFRRKYNIPFGSKEHLNMSPLDIVFDVYESFAFDSLWEEFMAEEEREKAKESGHWLGKRALSKEEGDDLFDKMDLDDMVGDEYAYGQDLDRELPIDDSDDPAESDEYDPYN